MTKTRNVVAVIQARLGSSRLERKMFQRLKNIPLIEWVLTRLKSCEMLDMCVVAIPDTPENDPLSDWITAFGVPVYRGSECHVLERFYRASLYLK